MVHAALLVSLLSRWHSQYEYPSKERLARWMILQLCTNNTSTYDRTTVVLLLCTSSPEDLALTTLNYMYFTIARLHNKLRFVALQFIPGRGLYSFLV